MSNEPKLGHGRAMYICACGSLLLMTSAYSTAVLTTIEIHAPGSATENGQKGSLVSVNATPHDQRLWNEFTAFANTQI